MLLSALGSNAGRECVLSCGNVSLPASAELSESASPDSPNIAGSSPRENSSFAGPALCWLSAVRQSSAVLRIALGPRSSDAGSRNRSPGDR